MKREQFPRSDCSSLGLGSPFVGPLAGGPDRAHPQDGGIAIVCGFMRQTLAPGDNRNKAKLPAAVIYFLFAHQQSIIVSSIVCEYETLPDYFVYL
jgi:hypothetical protein